MKSSKDKIDSECSKDHQKTNRTKTLPFRLLVSVSTRTRKISEAALSVHRIQNRKNDELINHINWINYEGQKYKLQTSSGGSYFWPGKLNTFFSLTLAVVVVLVVFVVVFEELDIVLDFTFQRENKWNHLESKPNFKINKTDYT